MIPVLKEAAQRVGGVPALAERLGVSRQALYQWRRIPAEKVAALARETGMAEPLLRPDLFGPPAELIRGPIPFERDFAAWAVEQAAALKRGQFESLDVENLCEEIEDLARRDKDEIESRLAALVKHLLKVCYQTDQRSPSWDSTILEQRARIARRIARSPSLRGYPAKVLDDEYALARREASIETGLPTEHFPRECPFGIEEILDLDFMPTPETS